MLLEIADDAVGRAFSFPTTEGTVYRFVFFNDYRSHVIHPLCLRNRYYIIRFHDKSQTIYHKKFICRKKKILGFIELILTLFVESIFLRKKVLYNALRRSKNETRSSKRS